MQRILCLLLAVGCVVLIGWSGMRASDALAAARADKLFDAEGAVVRATGTSLEQARIPDRLVRSVQNLVSDPALDLEFLTVRNARNITLVSRGRLGESGGWLAAINSPTWRSWFYRAVSAEAKRAIIRDGQTVGFMHFGVSWTSIAYRAGMPLFIWAAAMLAGVIGLFGLILRLRSAAPVSDAQSSARVARHPAAVRDKPHGARMLLSRLARRASVRKAEFAPISDARSQPSGADVAPESVKKPAASRIAATTPQTASVPAVERPAPSPREAAPATQADAEAQADVAPVQQSVPAPRVEVPVSRLPPVAVETPRIDARPQLGDSTLDLRFYPIWRGGGYDTPPILAGACAALAWRTGDAELVDADTLTRLAEKDGALRAFTQWIARRFSLLQGNWRTLELSTVPIVLPIPSAMLAFADAEAVWRDALRRTDRDPNDLILRLDCSIAVAEQASLPLRRALSVAEPDDALPSDCDVLCLNPANVKDDVSAWRARFDALDRPVLFGPLADPAQHPDIIAHERVLWFSEREQDVHAPRSFARLLARHAPVPI